MEFDTSKPFARKASLSQSEEVEAGTRTPVEIDAQYRVLREQAGIVDRPDRRFIAVSGAEGAEYLQGQLTNDVEALAPGEGQYTALLDRKGHMQSDMRLLRLGPDEILIDLDAVAADAVLRHLSLYKVGREVEVTDVSPTHALLSVIGPAAAHAAGAGPLAPEHAHTELEVGGRPTRAIATALGLDLVVQSEHVEAVEAALAAAGAEPASADAAEIIRVESGRPRFGAEMTSATMPAEAGIEESAVSFTKGCYIGQETVARLHYKGRPNRHLRGLRLSAPVPQGATVTLGERELGTVGGSVLSPAHGAIALAILRREAEPGATVGVGDDVTAEVVELPF